MLVVETIARIRRDHLARGVPIKKIARDLRVSKNTVHTVGTRFPQCHLGDAKFAVVIPCLCLVGRLFGPESPADVEDIGIGADLVVPGGYETGDEPDCGQCQSDRIAG